MADVQRLRAVLAHIEAHPELWEQGHWSRSTECGTAYCFAGWALALEGIQTRPDMIGSGFVPAEDLPERVRSGLVRHSVGSDGRYWITVSDVARWLLGVDRDEADRLFEGSNALPDLRVRVAEVCERQRRHQVRTGAGVV